MLTSPSHFLFLYHVWMNFNLNYYLSYKNVSRFCFWSSLVCPALLQASSGNYYFIPYVMTPNNEYICCENVAQRRASEYMQPSWDNLLGPLCVPLVDRFASLLKDIHVTSWYRY